MKIVRLLQGKLLAIVLVSIAVVGGATAFAATSAGQRQVHEINSQAHAAVTPAVRSHGKSLPTSSHHTNTNSKDSCPGLPDVKRLATQFALSTDSASNEIQALCALHQGTFTGTTPNGASVSSLQVFGYGEIDQLLTYAQFLAGQDKANVGGKLTSDNAQSFLAEAIQSCGTTPLMTCLNTNIPGFQPGNSNDPSHGDENSHGKHGSIPTPHH